MNSNGGSVSRRALCDRRHQPSYGVGMTVGASPKRGLMEALTCATARFLLSLPEKRPPVSQMVWNSTISDSESFISKRF